MPPHLTHTPNLGQTEGVSFRPFDAGWKKQRRFLNQVLNPSAVRIEYYNLQAKRTYQWVFEFLDHPEGFDVWPSLKRMSGEIITTLGYGASREGDVDFIDLIDKLAGTFQDAVAGSISGAFFLLREFARTPPRITFFPFLSP